MHSSMLCGSGPLTQRSRCCPELLRCSTCSVTALQVGKLLRTDAVLRLTGPQPGFVQSSQIILTSCRCQLLH